MNWLCEVSYFFGGAFLSNAIPHFVSGTMGRPFQTPFAKPPGKGLSSSRVNIVWGIANFVLADLLLARVGQFDLRSMRSMIPLLLGLLVMSLYAARHFGQFYGGNDPEQS